MNINDILKDTATAVVDASPVIASVFNDCEKVGKAIGEAFKMIWAKHKHKKADELAIAIAQQLKKYFSQENNTELQDLKRENLALKAELSKLKGEQK